jgi:HK97 family phage portal protein
VKNWLPALYSKRTLKQIEDKSAEQLQIKAIQNIFTPALTAMLSEQVWGKGIGAPPIYPDWTTTAATNAYINIDQVFSVVNKIAETTSLIPLYVYYQKDEKAMRKLLTISNRQFYSTKGIFDIMLMQMKALEDAPETDPVLKLLNHPNPQQSQQEFFLANFCYYLLCGECFIYKFRGTNGANTGRVTELHVLAPSNIILHVSKEYPQAVTGYDFVMGSETIYKNIPVNDIIHIKKFNPDSTLGYDFRANYSRWRGLSPLVPAKKLLTRLTSADDAAVSQLQNGGLPGIVFDKTLGNEDVSQESLDLMRQHFFSYIRKPENKGAPFFSAGEKGYVQLGLKLADMEVSALQNIDFKRLCNIYKISTILFNSEVAATESNVKEMVKQMYTNVCLPLAYTFRDKFNSELVSENWGDKRKRFVDADISGITELQDDYQQLANVISALPITPTGNEMRELFKWDRIENPMMDIPLVKAGYSLIDDLAPMDMPVDQTAA